MTLRPPKNEAPTRLQMLVHRAKVRAHQVRRFAAERGGPSPGARSSYLATTPVVAEHVSALWRHEDPREWILQAGKVHNLRIAAGALDGTELSPGQVFSFWAHLGRPTRRRGFVSGRELREGCVVPAIAGGICQLSNALYGAALDAGLQIVERHAHSRVLPGSAAQSHRDATVFWNYVDLRFVAGFALRIEVELTADALIVRLKGRAPNVAANARPSNLAVVDGDNAKSCLSCERIDCGQYAPAVERTGERAFLVDGLWPELDRYVREHARPTDHLLLPLDGARWGRPRYAWSSGAFDRTRVHSFVVHTAGRALVSRRLAEQGAQRQRALLELDARLAEAMAETLPPEVTDLVVAQNLLPHLWRAGHLGGRRFDVLATRLPLASLQRTLDAAARLHPTSTTIADFRADPRLVAAETEALQAADRIITPHSAIADEHDTKAVRLPWTLSASPEVGTKPQAGARPRILFPASTVARKGCYELRDAIADLDVELVTRGSMLEGPDFWATTRRGPDGPVDLVVLPAWVEHAPRSVLRALASGVPALVSPGCGLRGVAGVTEVPAGDPKALRRALIDAVAPGKRLRAG